LRILGIDITELESYKEGMKEGKKEGKKEGMKEGIITLGLSLLEKKFKIGPSQKISLRNHFMNFSDPMMIQKVIINMLKQENYENAQKIFKLNRN